MKLLILDFDHTISNSRAFAQSCMDELLISREEYYKQLEDLSDDTRLNVLREKIPTYRFEGVETILEKMNEVFDKTILLTKAGYSLKWQQSVIQSSGLVNHFDEVKIVTDSKVNHVQDISKQNPGYDITFVNDIYSHEPENDMLRESNPEITIFDIDNYTSNGFTTGHFSNTLK